MLQGVLLLIGLCAAKVLGMMFALVIDGRAERAHRRHARQAIEAAAMKASARPRGGRSVEPAQVFELVRSLARIGADVAPFARRLEALSNALKNVGKIK